MKKALVILIALAVLGGNAFAKGGSESSGDDGPIVIDVMAYGTNSNNEGMNWVRIVEAFEAENPNIDIQYEMLYDEAFHNKVQARIASGDIPDLAYTGADARWASPWRDAGLQFDHRDLIDASFYDLNLIPPMGPNGEIFEIPLGTSNLCTVLYMNEALVKELGFSAPETYDDIVAMVPAAQAAGLEVISIDGADSWAWGSCVMSMVISRMSGNPNWVKEAVEEGKHKFTDPEFVKSLEFIAQMVEDGVISSDSVLVDYGTNLSNYSTGKALFCVQGQWAAGDIDAGGPEVADNTVMMAWPALPEEKSATAGSIASAVQVGYGIINSAKVQANPAVAKAIMTFLQYYYSVEETTQRLRDGAIVAPILKGFEIPSDLSLIIQSKIKLGMSGAVEVNVVDAYLSGDPNDALNSGMQEIVAGTKTPQQVAEEVEALR
jgi:raffinose/stachyose/melibiose transport system substrate-binding protein